MQSNNIIKVLENKKAQSFIRSNINGDIAVLALKNTAETSYNMAECLQLIKIYKKAIKKLPLFWDNLLALDERSYAQCTSEAVARYKSLFLSGNRLLDLTGGIGVDSLFLKNSFKDVIAIEHNHDLHQIASYNIEKLEVRNLSRIKSDALTYLKECMSISDLIYIDPDRRSKFGRSVALEHLSPNVLELLPLLKKRTKQVYLKLSPLFDLKEVYRRFSNVQCIFLIAEKGEIKEVGVWLDFSLADNKSVIRLKDVSFDFEYTIEELTPRKENWYLENAKNLHLPLALVAKSRSAGNFLEGIEYRKHSDFEIYYSNEPYIIGFRSFKIVDKSPLAKKKVARMLADAGIQKCTIIVKGSTQRAEDWHKKLKTKDGGDVYLILFHNKTTEAVLAQLIS
ncbi:hypothetical protein N9772_05065 [Bacteroidia bacterium]|nr:hypothetical protein [Bacteroidia bacterium]